MEADFFFGPKKFSRLQEALEELDNAEEADNDVDLVIVPSELAAETDEEEGDGDGIEDLGVRSRSRGFLKILHHMLKVHLKGEERDRLQMATKCASVLLVCTHEGN
ncbi:hypothetical protein MRX96_033394 [Rhipicephalus microplus]